jgi:ABC-type transport system involved in multi-copper enzyme maturation permease subunit
MTAPYQQSGPASGYLSPIPVRRATFGDALASEWTKLRSVRSTMWTLGVMILLMLGVGVLAAVAVAASDTDTGDGSFLALGFFGVLLGSICVITLGVLAVTSEFGTGMIRTTLTACPSRVRVLSAKALVFFLLVFSLTTVTTAVVGGLQGAILRSASPAASGADWFRATAGVGLYIAVLGLLSMAVGTLLRHSAGAITAMIGVVLLPLVLSLFIFAESLAGLRDALFNYSIPSQLSVFYGTAGSTGSGPAGWDPLWILLAATAIALGGAMYALDKRDV